MRLLRIRPRFFRGFGDSEWIDLASDLVAIYGPNAFGKTSLAEAIEWLFFGKTKRREKGEGFSLEEHKGSYRNVHAPLDEDTSVEAVLLLPDCSEIHVVRKIDLGPGGRDTESRFLINGNAGNPSELGISGSHEAYPVVVQHGLQDFIHARPVVRRDKLSAAFGLDTLIAYSRFLDSARRKLNTQPPEVVGQAKPLLQRAMQQMNACAGFLPVVGRWQDDTIDAEIDRPEIMSICRKALGLVVGEPPELLASLDQLRRRTAVGVFDDAPIRPPADLSDHLERLRRHRSDAAFAVKRLLEAFSRQQQVAAQAYAIELLRFWRMGLSLLPTGSDTCPMCEADTLTPAKREELLERITRSQKYMDCTAEIDHEIDLARNSFLGFSQLLLSLIPDVPCDAQQALRSLIDAAQSRPFLDSHRDAGSLLVSATTQAGQLPAKLEELRTAFQQPVGTEPVHDLAEALFAALTTACASACEAATLYAEAFTSVKPALDDRISADEKVREIDALIQSLDAALWQNLKVIQDWKSLYTQIADEVRSFGGFLQRKQDQVFAAKGQEICEWYDLLCPGTMTGFSKMEPTSDSIKLHAESFGRSMSAAACLSQSQLNSLGLSVYLTLATPVSSPFGFLVLDDPVQAMDDHHYEAFKINAIPKLLEELNLQLILLSHWKPLVKDVIYQTCTRQYLGLNILDFTCDGPIFEHYLTIQEELQKLKMMAGGDQYNRRSCAQQIRIVTDRIVRCVYCSQTGQSMPAKYDSATTRILISCLEKKVDNVSQQVIQGLRGTADFCSPAGHDERSPRVASTVPAGEALRPHIDRLEEVASKYDVLSQH